MEDIKTMLLNDGTHVPVLAYGIDTAAAHVKTECSEHIVLALQKGFRHLDTAHGYGNEESVAIALKKWGGKREDVFICSKWGWSDPEKEHDAEAQLADSLKKMGVDYIDLYLIHLPNPSPYSNSEAWKQMESFKGRGLVRSIGVSQFRAEHIEELAKMWRIKPCMNQLEYNPYTFHDPRMKATVNTCEKYNITISPFTTLSPLTRFAGGPVDDVVSAIAKNRGVKPAQVLLAWASQKTHGGPIITAASKEWQYEQILTSCDINLSAQEMDEVAEAGKRGGPRSRFTLATWDLPQGAVASK